MDRGLVGPGGNAQIEREGDGLRGAEREAHLLLKRIVGLLRQGHLLPVGHHRRRLIGSIEHRGQTVVGGSHDEMLGKVGPAHAVVVLTATTAEGTHGEHAAQTVVDAGRMVLAVADGHVGRGDIAQGPHVGGQGGRQGVESHILAVVGPRGVARDAHHHLVAGHLFHHGTGLGTLSRVAIAGAGILVGTIHAAGHLSVLLAHVPLVVVCTLQGLLVARQHVVGGRLAEALCHVHPVPVGQVVLHHPVAGVAVQLLYQRQQRLVARAVVEPDDAPLVVAAALVLPVVLQEQVVVYRQLPLEVVGHGSEHALVATMLVVGLQGPEHDHLCPHLGPSARRVAWPQESVGLQVLQHGFKPHLRLLLHGLVVQYIRQAAVAAQPVGHLLPSVVARVAEPLVAALVEPGADGAQLSVESRALSLQVFQQPPLGSHLSHGQLQQIAAMQRCPVARVVGTGSEYGSVYDRRLSLCLPRHGGHGAGSQ